MSSETKPGFESTNHDYCGNVHVGRSNITLEATGEQVYRWSRKPGAHWPCSDLSEVESISASFDETGLYDLSVTPEDAYYTADEFNAWSSDVLADVLPTNHPAYYVTVGQFKEGY